MAQLRDRLVELTERGDGVSRRIGDGLRKQLEEPGRTRLEPPDRSMEGRPQVGSPPEEAHLEQVVDRLDENLVVRSGGVGCGFDGTYEQPVRGVHIPITIQQVIARRDRAGQGTGMVGIHLPDVVQQTRRVPQVAQHRLTDVRSQRPPTALVSRRGAQLRGPRHLDNRAYGVASFQMRPRDVFEQ